MAAAAMSEHNQGRWRINQIKEEEEVSVYLEKKFQEVGRETWTFNGKKIFEEETAPEKEAENRSKKLFKCDQCDNQLKSDNGLRIQVGKSHKNENSGSSLWHYFRTECNTHLRQCATLL